MEYGVQVDNLSIGLEQRPMAAVERRHARHGNAPPPSSA
jgi:hypothetical protein